MINKNHSDKKLNFKITLKILSKNEINIYILSNTTTCLN